MDVYAWVAQIARPRVRSRGRGYLTPIVFSFVLHRVEIVDHKSGDHCQIIINLHY